MIFRNLDVNHDWTFGSGKANYVSGDVAIGLNIETRILSWVGDCFFNTKAGIDWLNRLGTKGQEKLLNADLQRIIQSSYGVTGIISLSISLNGRSFNAQYNITTINSASYKNQVTKVFANA